MSYFDLGSSRKKQNKANRFGFIENQEMKEATERKYIESKRSKNEESEDVQGWLLTYSDMVTLLLTFFILLYTVSDVNQEKFEQVKSAISGEMLKKKEEKPFEKVKEELEAVIKDNKLEKSVTVETNPLGVKVELASSSLYESGSAIIKNDMQGVLAKVSMAIQQIDLSNFEIEVEGHTDDIPMQSARYESNWELSSHRATNVVKLLIKSGIKPSTVKASGFADSRPLVPNRDANGISIPENQEKNRRVSIYVRRSTSFKKVPTE